MNKSLVVILSLLVAFIIICCLCLGFLTFSGIAASFLFGGDFDLGSFLLDEEPTSTPVVIRPSTTPVADPGNSVETDEPVHPGTELDTLYALRNETVPVSDLVDLAERLEGKLAIPRIMDPPLSPLRVGNRESFWMIDTDSDVHFRVDATLRYVTDHLYFWIEDGLSYSDSDLADLANTFETDIYPTNHQFFGSEWTPGVDGDPHLYIIYASGLGDSLAGYFSSSDEYHPLAHEYSNGHETFVLNYDTLELDDPYTYGVLAHEFQHMIHWYQDKNESTWLNEGFSELAAFLNGYDPGGFDYLYALNPDMQLTYWPDDSDETSPHYGASFLFVSYFLDRFGDEVTQSLVQHSGNGMDSLDAVLSDLDAHDPATGEAIKANDVFLDWAIANFLQDETVGDGRYDYYSYNDLPDFEETESINSCKENSITRDVHQYGADYIKIKCPGEIELIFEGSIEVDVLPEDFYSGSYGFWSNRGDESNMTLTRSFDFSNHPGPIEISFWTWFDLEKDYDYVYLEASLDGKNWDIVTTPSGTPDDPSGNSYGWGYNGLSGISGEWIEEKISLSDYAGKEVFLRFEYVTDAAVNGEGMLIDDISIPAIGYFTDFEGDDGGWIGEGFVRIGNRIPLEFQVALITFSDDIKIRKVNLSHDNSAVVIIPGNVKESILVITGTTRYTRQKAAYRIIFDVK